MYVYTNGEYTNFHYLPLNCDWKMTHQNPKTDKIIICFIGKRKRTHVNTYSVYIAIQSRPSWVQCYYYYYYYAALLHRRGPHIASHSVCLSVCLFVRPVIVYIRTVLRANIQNRKTSVFAYGPASRMYFSARAEGRISYGHLGCTNLFFFAFLFLWQINVHIIKSAKHDTCLPLPLRLSVCLSVHKVVYKFWRNVFEGRDVRLAKGD